MENIVPKISSSLSKMWNKVLNLEKSLFLALKEELRLEELSHKEQKLPKIEKRLQEHLSQRVFTILP
jgi:hypothetical protein